MATTSSPWPKILIIFRFEKWKNHFATSTVVEILNWALWNSDSRCNCPIVINNYEKRVDFKSTIYSSFVIWFNHFFWNCVMFQEDLGFVIYFLNKNCKKLPEICCPLIVLEENSVTSLILNQRYLPHLNSDSADFFFEFGFFSARNLDMLFVSKNFTQKFSDLLWKLAAHFFFFTSNFLLCILFTASITFALIPCRNFPL